jgi:hypothetical protein
MLFSAPIASIGLHYTAKGISHVAPFTPRPSLLLCISIISCTGCKQQLPVRQQQAAAADAWHKRSSLDFNHQRQI